MKNRRSRPVAAALVVTITSVAQAQRVHREPIPIHTRSDSALFAQERANFRLAIDGSIRENIVSAARAMPADKYGFAPTAGEFRKYLHMNGIVPPASCR